DLGDWFDMIIYIQDKKYAIRSESPYPTFADLNVDLEKIMKEINEYHNSKLKRIKVKLKKHFAKYNNDGFDTTIG
ncbi:MAG: hypothetical protein ACOCP8_06720, partial [archaeon]